MTRRELRKCAYLYIRFAMNLRNALLELGESETPGEAREDVQTELVDVIHRCLEYCEGTAKFYNDQADLQSHDSAIEADAQEERMR